MKKFLLYTELLAKTDRVRSKIGTFPILVHNLQLLERTFSGFIISKESTQNEVPKYATQ